MEFNMFYKKKNDWFIGHIQEYPDYDGRVDMGHGKLLLLPTSPITRPSHLGVPHLPHPEPALFAKRLCILNFVRKLKIKQKILKILLILSEKELWNCGTTSPMSHECMGVPHLHTLR